MQVGEKRTWERTFTTKDVRQFEQVSRDHGIQYVLPDEQGRLMVHGLLTATLPNKLGSEINYVPRNISFEFVRPVFVGDTIRCEITITQLEEEEQRTSMSATVVCRNQQGNVVLMGNTAGFIRKPQVMNVGLH